jgi:hypothetical protein
MVTALLESQLRSPGGDDGDDSEARKNGQRFWVADLAELYGFTDIDGYRVPRFDPKAPVREGASVL